MATPIIRSNGSISGQVTGQGRNNLVTGEIVTLTDTVVANVGLPYAWLLVDRPIGSASVLTTPGTPTSTFIPDVTGSYHIRCTVNGVDVFDIIIAVPLAVTGGRIPSFDETLEYNAGGNLKGWHTDLTAFMRQADVLIGASSSDEMVKASAADTTPGRLQSKLTVASGSGLVATILNPGGNEALQLDTITAVREHFSKTSVTDTTPAYLGAKIIAGSNVVVTVLNPGANETVSISAGASDPNAIHSNVAAEINAIAVKATPVNGDLLLIEDSAAGNAKKKILIGSLPGGTDTDALHKSVANEITSLSLKPSPIGADVIVIEDSSAGFVKKKAALSTLPPDATALHSATANEISALANKAVPVAADVFLIEDSATGFTKKKVPFTVFGSGVDGNAVHVNVAGEIAGITTKTVPIGADLLIIEDSAAANAKKKILISSLPPDSTAIHTTTANEISALTVKGTPVGADILIIEDSAAGNSKKKILISSLPGTTDPNAIHGNTASEISALTLKATPTGTDLLIIEDSAAGNVKKSITISSLATGAVLDYKVKVSVADTVANFLSNKLSAGTNITLGIVNPGANETVSITGPSTLPPNGSAGGDLGGTYPNPEVAAIHETSGPTKLTVGAVVTGQYLLRSGSTVISGVPLGDHKPAVSAGDTTPDYLFTKLVAGTNVTLTKNNPGANETITIAASGGGGGSLGASGEKFINPTWAAGHDSNETDTEKVVGTFSFDPSLYTLTGTTKAITIRAIAAVGNSSIVGHVKLRDITNAVNIHTFDFSGGGATTAAEVTATLTTGTPGADVIANSAVLYEVRIYVDSPTIPTDFIELWKSEMRVTNTIT